MARLTWAPAAIDDLNAIGEYVARNSPHYARIIVRDIRKLARSIPQMPRLGSMVPEYDRDDLRERLYHNWRIIYRIRGTDIEIVRIIHGARQLPPLPSTN